MSGFPRILAVDDNKQNLSLLERALTAAQYEVITAADGPTALQLIDSALPEVGKKETCEDPHYGNGPTYSGMRR